MKKFHKPIRMCVVCKGRLLQKELFRFAYINNEIISNPIDVRSFYICKECIHKDEKKLKKSVSRFCKNSVNLKEIFIDG